MQACALAPATPREDEFAAVAAMQRRDDADAHRRYRAFMHRAALVVVSAALILFGIFTEPAWRGL